MKITDINRWREEIRLGEKFREEQFGKFTMNERDKAGLNIEYYEKGFGDKIVSDYEGVTTLNVIDSLVSIIVPALYFKNPRTIVTPTKIESEDTAPLVGRLIDHFRKRSEVEDTNQKLIWDAYVLGYGVYKIGYATKFGKDVRDEERETEKEKNIVQKGLEALGISKKKEEKIVRPEQDLRIEAESPFVEYINPFDFALDPRATSLNDAQWWSHKIRKSVKELKENKKYKNTEEIKGFEPQVRTIDFSNISEAEQEAFKTVNLWEIHYRVEEDFYILVISQDGDGEWREHYHEESIYELGEWQCDMLTFKKHGHMLYPKSDITKIRPLQDRITSTIDSILEQVDRFVPKLAFEIGGLTEEGKRNLEDGGVGALVECNRSPMEVFKELNFTQLKTDLQALIDQLITLISIQTGITRAQLTGLSDTSTATEASIAQGGQTLRLSDMSGKVQRFVNKQSVKLWKVVRQFTPLEELELINGSRGVKDGAPVYDWLTINTETSQRLQEGEYDFDIEIGSTEKINLAVVRKSFENLFNILARSEVISLMQQQGDNVVLSEILRKYADLFPELGIDSSRFIQKMESPTGGIVGDAGAGGVTEGSNQNALAAQLSASAPSQPQILSEASQI